MPHLMKRMRHLIKDNEKKLSTTWYIIVIYTIQTITILSQQNKRHWNLFKQYIIFKKRFTVTVVSDLRKVISKQIPPSNKCPPLHKRRIRNTENLINAAAFNQINTVQSTLSKMDTFRTGTKCSS